MHAFVINSENANGLNSLTAVDPDDITYEEAVADLNVEFTREFGQTGLAQSFLKEMVYAVDHLYEIAHSPNYPNDRLLTTPDIEMASKKAISDFSKHAERQHDASLHGCAVGPATKQLIDEFFEQGYLSTLSVILDKLKRNFLMFSLDGLHYTVTLKRYSPNNNFGVLSVNIPKLRIFFSLPFNLSRLKDPVQ